MDYAMQFGLNRQVNAYPWRLVAQATQQSWHIELKQISICSHRKALTILVVGMLKSGYAQRKVQHKIAIQPSNKTEVDLWKFHGGRDRACWAESLQFVAKRFQSHGNQQRWAARPTTLAMRLIMLCIQFQAFVSHCQDTRNRTPLNRKQAHSCKGVCRLGWIKGTEKEPVHTHTINGAAVQQLGAQTSNFKSLSPRAAVAAFCHLPLRQLGELQLAEVNQSTMSEDSIGPVFKEDVLAITAVDAEDDACDTKKNQKKQNRNGQTPMPSSKHPENRHSGSRHLHHTLMKLKGEITAAGSVDLGAQYFHWSLFCDTAAIWNQLANHAVDAASRLVINMLRSVFDTLSFRSHSFQKSQYFFDFLPIQNPLSPTLCKHYSSGESLIWDTLLSTSWTMLHPFVKNLPIAASRACPLCYIYEINYFRMRGWAGLTVFSEPQCASNQTKTRNYLLLLFFLCRELPRIRDSLAIEASGFELGDRLSSVHIEKLMNIEC